MKIFISWSGEVSHKVAKALRDWLPSVIQSITPYVSSEDIDKGARWSSDIASELDESAFGLLCVTPDNINAPWLNFEAGALGKSVDKSRVCPFLFRIKRSDVKGPILQYQSTIHDKEDIFKLMKAVNAACGEHGIEELRLEKAFDVWWPKLDEELKAIELPAQDEEAGSDQPEEIYGYVSRVLEEVLEISRTNQKLLRDPTTILPPDYFEHVIDRLNRDSRLRKRGMLDERLTEERIHPGALEDLVVTYRELLKFFGKIRHRLAHQPEYDEMLFLLRKMDDPLRYLCNNIGMRLPREVLDDFDGVI
ncbi:TIR domain-containing protein [Stutzerimonas frequens]|uniref:TIR domain-containing protein n=1 Tax=Stutzerimonas frequens TaxID=2968969 RepID=UPI002DBEDAA7|nr:TIR domain-containing protein [Stutzerimonas frequens]WRW27081.1 TIR domain-containing protein [Stutzerimonas frequens]